MQAHIPRPLMWLEGQPAAAGLVPIPSSWVGGHEGNGPRPCGPETLPCCQDAVTGSGWPTVSMSSQGGQELTARSRGLEGAAVPRGGGGPGSQRTAQSQTVHSGPSVHGSRDLDVGPGRSRTARALRDSPGDSGRGGHLLGQARYVAPTTRTRELEDLQAAGWVAPGALLENG